MVHSPIHKSATGYGFGGLPEALLKMHSLEHSLWGACSYIPFGSMNAITSDNSFAASFRCGEWSRSIDQC